MGNNVNKLNVQIKSSLLYLGGTLNQRAIKILSKHQNKIITTTITKIFVYEGFYLHFCLLQKNKVRKQMETKHPDFDRKN